MKRPEINTRRGKKRFIKSWLNSVRETIYQHIENGNIPDDWDGHELRALVADMFEHDARISLIRSEPRNKRARSFRNICYTSTIR